MGWKNLGEKPVVGTPWFRLNLAEVELPGGRRLDHYVLRLPPVVLAAVLDAEGRVLMLWRHRFIPDTYGWEIPSGIADPAEDLAAAAARETYKESGWEPQELLPLIRLEAASGLTNSVNHVYWSRRALHRGDPPAAFEAERIDWIPLDQVPRLIAIGQIRSAVTAAALMLLRDSRTGDAQAGRNRDSRPGRDPSHDESGPGIASYLGTPITAAEGTTMFEHTKAFSGFSADDIPAAKKFYGETLGIPVSEEHGIVTLHIAGDRDTIIYPKSDHVPATFTILNFPVPDIEATVDELTARGVEFEHYDFVDPKGINRRGGPLIAWFKDPAGNVLSVIQAD